MTLKRTAFIILFILISIISTVSLLPVITFFGYKKYVNFITPMFEFCNKIL